MNNLHSNERYLADKLRNTPVPDVDQSWEKMRGLLDREMPEAAGAWAGYNKWGWMAMTAGIIMVAAWLTQFLNRPDQTKLAGKTQTESSKLNADNSGSEKSTAVLNNKQTTSSSEQTITPGNPSNQPQTTNPQAVNATGTDGQNEAKAEGDNSNKASSSANKQNFSTTDRNIVSNEVNKDRVEANRSQTSQADVVKNNAGNDKAFKPASKLKSSNKISVDNTKQSNQIVADSHKNAVQTIANRTPSAVPGNEKNELQNTENAIDVKRANINTSIIEDENAINPADAFSSVAFNQPGTQAIAGKTDKKSLRELRKQYIKEDNRRMSRSGMRGNFGDNGKDITFAAGLALPQSMTLSGQQSPSYGVSGKSNKLTDYLPAPFFQYYLNSKLFLQTEFHFQSPQYTDRLLLARSITEPSSNMKLEKNVYLEKLYYFNIPINLYYSPVRNVSIGTGLQYSSLLSGVASFEERRTEGQNPVAYQSVTRRFKDDSVAAKFAPSEWRYQFDANYYVRRFTLGLRYNQAMKDFVNLRINNTLPLTQDRNRSFLFYLRYNIWEERKKD
ncbi:MAG: hypothetical protein WCF67_03980 [Chitinophagaceae bacterium]